jgi:hypothetical protein
MRRHRIIFPAAFLAAAIAALTAGCDNNKKDVEAAKRSVFDVDFAVIYSAALEATRENYPNLEDAPGRGAIKTAWHQVSNAASPDDPASPSMANGAGIGAANTAAANSAAGGMPTRLAYKRFYIRFDISITGGRPWRLRVVGHAAMWEPGASDPEELHGAQRPSWLEGRTDALTAAIYKRIKPYAIPAKENGATTDEGPRADASAFAGVPPGAAQALAAIKNAASARDFTALRSQLSDDVVWSLGGGAGADVAVATWQADPEPLDAMVKLLGGACGGDAKKVSCPAGPPAPGAYQLVLEPRPLGWRVTSYVKAE